MIKDLLIVDKQVKCVNILAVLFQWSYILFNLLLIIFSSDSIMKNITRIFSILAFLILNFVVNFSLYENARRKESTKFSERMLIFNNKRM